MKISSISESMGLKESAASIATPSLTIPFDVNPFSADLESLDRATLHGDITITNLLSDTVNARVFFGLSEEFRGYHLILEQDGQQLLIAHVDMHKKYAISMDAAGNVCLVEQ